MVSHSAIRNQHMTALLLQVLELREPTEGNSGRSQWGRLEVGRGSGGWVETPDIALTVSEYEKRSRLSLT